MEETFYAKIRQLNPIDWAFKKGVEFSTFLFPVPEFLMTDLARESSLEHENLLGYNVYDSIKKDTAERKQATLSGYANAFGNTFQSMAIIGALILGIFIIKEFKE